MIFGPATRIGKWLHWIFEASLVIKGILAGGETLGGFGLWLAPNHLIVRFVDWMTRNELTQDPSDNMALWFHHAASRFPIDTQHFYAVYLLAHGALKFTMVIMLGKRIVWAYPLAMLVLAGFVTYQSAEFIRHGGIVLVALTALDSLMIALVWREYTILRHLAKPT